MRKSFLRVVGFMVGLGATGCSSVYMPNVPNTPMLTSKGELSTSGHITLKGNASFNSAYAVTDHVGVLLSGAMMNNNNDKKDFRHNLLEAGGGYFTTFGPNQNRVLEVYAGIGRGSSDRTYKDKTSEGLMTYDRQETTFNKYFMQVNYSSKKKRLLKLFGNEHFLNYGTALRLSYVTMGEFVRNDIKQPTEDNIFFEPIFYTRMTLTPSIQLQYTSGSNFGLKNRDFMTAGNSVFSIGFIVNVGGRKLKKDAPRPEDRTPALPSLPKWNKKGNTIKL
ncbi:hypothetical protein [Rufibacter sp. XAAS-G3-1]|uniref:hypothetical protein n=1 Tax=Rufibacter sp. XAAS-G3-1 TaxID=2729134 RepID=UPI001C62752A|nr:hypothetical protein [Rufibacter sp. XAAS-G3-1]